MNRAAALGSVDQPTRTALLSIIERVEKRSRHEIGKVAPTGTGTAGDWYTNTVANRVYRSDGVGWIIMSEPWQTYVPTLVAGVAVTKTVTYAKYQRRDGTCTVEDSLTITGIGTANTPITIGLPIAAAFTGLTTVGSFVYQDSGTAYYEGAAMLASTTTITGQAHNTGAFIGQAPAFTTANTDIAMIAVIYEMTTLYS